MTEENVFCPPRSLVERWRLQTEYAPANGKMMMVSMTTERLMELCQKSANYGADAELEACVEWLERQTLCGHRDLIPQLRAARRLPPPSLAKEALKALGSPAKIGESRIIEHGEHNAIRRAVERLAELEAVQDSPRENI